MSHVWRMLLAVLAALGSALTLLAVLSALSASPFDPVPYEPLPLDVKIETVVPGANQLVAMDFTPDGRLLYTERNTGKVRVVVNGVLQSAPVFTFPMTAGSTTGERGLLGLAVDPNFSTNHFVWVYFTRQSSNGQCSSPFENRVVRFTLGDDNQGFNEAVAGCFPVDQYATIHNGGNLHFGPDGKLYIAVGNNDDANDDVDPAQELGSPLGKIHRFDPTVPLSIPTDNPFYNMPTAFKSIYARGLRNSFDFTFDPSGGALFATENGEACDDEINRILPGGNYGWRPNAPCEDEWLAGPDPAYNTLPALIFWTPSLAPTGIAFYTGAAIPEWQGDMFMCSFKDSTTAVHHFKLNASRTAIVSHTILTDTVTHQRLKCRTDLLSGPDGALYFSEGGGYYNGPIKRLIRRTSFATTSVQALPLNPPSGGSVDYTIDLRHLGSFSNTFALTVNIPPAHAFMVSAQAQQGVLNQSVYQLLWSGTVTGVETWTATYRLQIGTVPATAYLLTHSLRLTARNAATVILTPTVMVNGTLTYLPMIMREN